MKPRGTLKATPDDFVVEEIAAYEPSGEGDHLFVTFRKRDRTTHDVARDLALVAGADARDVGVAGIKDKRAVTTQTISIPVRAGDDGAAQRVASASLEGVTVLDVRRHVHKLRTGHLTANRFEIVIRDLPGDRIASLVDAFTELAKSGVPNAFGPQRFGNDGLNAERARAWLRGEARPPRSPKARRFDFSALQSRIFNDVLEARIARGGFRATMAGDVLKKTDTGGLFVSTDEGADRARAERGEVVPTGPIFGDKMMRPEGEARELEDRIAAPWLEGVDLAAARKLGEGTRRSLVLQVDAMEARAGEDPGTLRLRFVLPKGAFATTVLSCAIDLAPADIQGSTGDDSA